MSFSIQQFMKYGYSNKIDPDVGNIPSGSLGSGVVVITLSLMIGTSLIWLNKLWTHEVGSKDIGIDDDVKEE